MMRLTSLAAKWNAYARKPFPLLVRLSIDRIVHGSNASEDEELNINFGVVLALLAIPGGFASIFLFDKYGSFLQWLRGQTNFDPLAAAFPDEYFFIVLSMAVAGGVAVWWWDSIFPDRRDFHNLVHLPVPMSKIFLANSVAVLILTSVCAIDVNGASAILFPFIVGGAQPTFSFMARFAGVHALVVVLASIFSFFAVFATAGLLMLVLPYPLFRRVSLRPAVGDALNQLCGSRHDPGLAPFPALSRPAPTFSLVRRILPVTARTLRSGACRNWTPGPHRAFVRVCGGCNYLRSCLPEMFRSASRVGRRPSRKCRNMDISCLSRV